MDSSPKYRENSLSLLGAVSLGTGVMIGAGIIEHEILDLTLQLQ